jgi:hypothetical protein
LPGKALAVYCSDNDGNEEDLYDFDTLEYAGILTTDSFIMNNRTVQKGISIC